MPKTTREWQEEIHTWAKGKGWWDQNDPEVPMEADYHLLATKIALCHTELSEALEELRGGRVEMYLGYEDNKPEGFGVELADAVIRIFDLAEALGIDLDELMEAKMAYNRGRPHMLGRTF